MNLQDVIRMCHRLDSHFQGTAFTGEYKRAAELLEQIDRNNLRAIVSDPATWKSLLAQVSDARRNFPDQIRQELWDALIFKGQAVKDAWKNCEDCFKQGENFNCEHAELVFKTQLLHVAALCIRLYEEGYRRVRVPE